MNERIRELAEQSGLRFTQLMSNPMVPVVDGKETDLEKFAQLIVRECIDIADEEDFDVMMKEGYPCSQTAKKIREHFRVEE